MVDRKQPRARHQKRICAPLLNATEKPTTARVIGYARVSREDQNLAMQITALRAAGATDLFVEKISAANAKRPMFNLMMKFIEPRDTLVLYAFNRLCRDLKQLLTIVDDMKAARITLRSTSEPHIDPFTTNGRLLISVTGAVDENERGRIRDRTRDGMAECKRQGMYLGRRKLFDEKQTAQIRCDRRTMTADAAAKKWKCSAATIEKYAQSRAKKT